jgi:putative hydrolase of the HAD superfamily
VDVDSILFDLDGTLVDVQRALHDCLRDFASREGIETVPRLTLALASVSLRESQSLSVVASVILQTWTARDAQAERLSAAGVAKALRGIHLFVRPDERVTTALSKCARWYSLGIVTNGSGAAQRAKCRAAEIDGIIPSRRVVVSGERGTRKPARALFEAGLAAIGATPERTLFVGDDEQRDIRGARAAGMRACLVAPYGTKTEADVRIDHVGQLAELLACAT